MSAIFRLIRKLSKQSEIVRAMENDFRESPCVENAVWLIKEASRMAGLLEALAIVESDSWPGYREAGELLLKMGEVTK